MAERRAMPFTETRWIYWCRVRGAMMAIAGLDSRANPYRKADERRAWREGWRWGRDNRRKVNP